MSRISSVIDLALWTWVDAATAGNVTVIWDKQDAPIRPPFPYVVLDILFGPVNLSRPSIESVSTDNFAYKFHKVFTFEVQVHAEDNHMGLLDGIIDALELPDTQEAMWPSGLAFMNHTGVRDISTLVNSGHVFRASADFVFHYGLERVFASGQIDTVAPPTGTITN